MIKAILQMFSARVILRCGKLRFKANLDIVLKSNEAKHISTCSQLTHTFSL